MAPLSTALDRSTAMAMLQAAVRAPSSHNTQPWRFRAHAGAVELRADRTRALPVNDPHDRELTISCGCALFNLRVAAAAAALPLHVRVLPDAHDEDLLATVEVAPSHPVPSHLAVLADMVGVRRTYRRAFAEQPVGAAETAMLVAVAPREQAWLHEIAGEELRHRVAALVAEGDAIQWANPSWRRELAAWMHPSRRGDGLALPELAVPIAQAVVRTFDMGHGVGARDHELADASPLLAVLGTDRDAPDAWLAAGQALQHVLLLACGLGLQASYLNQPIQIASLRPRLQELLGRDGFAQVLLRIGHPGQAVPATPRRRLTDTIDPD
jgi:nitroreductase